MQKCETHAPTCKHCLHIGNSIEKISISFRAVMRYFGCHKVSFFYGYYETFLQFSAPIEPGMEKKFVDLHKISRKQLLRNQFTPSGSRRRLMISLTQMLYLTAHNGLRKLITSYKVKYLR